LPRAAPFPGVEGWCAVDNVEIVVDEGEAASVVERVMGWWHGYYARAALERLDSSVGLVARAGGETLGAAVGFVARGEGPNIGVIYYVVVEEGYRGRGLGRLLAGRLREELEGRGAELLAATIEEGNDASIRLFSSLGYAVMKIVEAEDSLGWEALEAILHAACSYEEDYVALKPLRVSLEALKCLKAGAYRDVWWRACYEPWLHLRRARRRRW